MAKHTIYISSFDCAGRSHAFARLSMRDTLVSYIGRSQAPDQFERLREEDRSNLKEDGQPDFRLP